MSTAAAPCPNAVTTTILPRCCPPTACARLDLFDRLQLEAVLRICRRSRSLSDAGRQLFDRSREQRSVVNDADRLRKYLPKFGLTWEQARQ